jgi:hypothetical protein
VQLAEKNAKLIFGTAYLLNKQTSDPGTAKYFDFSNPSLHAKH